MILTEIHFWSRVAPATGKKHFEMPKNPKNKLAHTSRHYIDARWQTNVFFVSCVRKINRWKASWAPNFVYFYTGHKRYRFSWMSRCRTKFFVGIFWHFKLWDKLLSKTQILTSFNIFLCIVLAYLCAYPDCVYYFHLCGWTQYHQKKDTLMNTDWVPHSLSASELFMGLVVNRLLPPLSNRCHHRM